MDETVVENTQKLATDYLEIQVFRGSMPPPPRDSYAVLVIWK